ERSLRFSRRPVHSTQTRLASGDARVGMPAVDAALRPGRAAVPVATRRVGRTAAAAYARLAAQGGDVLAAATYDAIWVGRVARGVAHAAEVTRPIRAGDPRRAAGSASTAVVWIGLGVDADTVAVGLAVLRDTHAVHAFLARAARQQTLAVDAVPACQADVAAPAAVVAGGVQVDALPAAQ